MSAHELVEHMEHAGHAGGGHGGGDKGPGRMIGVTMALLGVMLAVCAALVGSHRTELIKTMVEQANKFGLYQSETMKYRVIEADYEMLKALTPKKDEVLKMEATLRTKRGSSGKEDDEDTAEVKDLIASATEDLADLLTPDPEEKLRFKKLAARYKHDMEEAKEDAEAYEPAIKAHQSAAESYEHGQLAAEIGIVIASVALLLGSRMIWMVSLAMLLLCAGTGGVTFMSTKAALEVADKHIEEAAKRSAALETDDKDEEGEGEAKAGAQGKPGEEKKPAAGEHGGAETKPAAEHKPEGHPKK